MLKKISLILTMVIILTVGMQRKALAAYSDGASIGASLFGGYPNSGLTLVGQFKGVPMMFGVNLGAGYGGAFGIGITGDWWGYKKPLGKAGESDVHFYLGPGFAVNIGFGSHFWSVSAGIRMPIGFSFIIKQKWEIFLEPAPTLNVLYAHTGGVSILGIDITKSGVHFYAPYLFSVAFQFGFRYWF